MLQPLLNRERLMPLSSDFLFLNEYRLISFESARYDVIGKVNNNVKKRWTHADFVRIYLLCIILFNLNFILLIWVTKDPILVRIYGFFILITFISLTVIGRKGWITLNKGADELTNYAKTPSKQNEEWRVSDNEARTVDSNRRLNHE